MLAAYAGCVAAVALLPRGWSTAAGLAVVVGVTVHAYRELSRHLGVGIHTLALQKLTALFTPVRPAS
jgi:peroxiredoxin